LSSFVHRGPFLISINRAKFNTGVTGYSVFASSSFLIRQGNSGKERRFPFAYLEIATRLFHLWRTQNDFACQDFVVRGRRNEVFVAGLTKKIAL
jgi:hypothetical protein